ncbi:toxin-antitoxin system YwqK family antitoxin [Flavobacterium procerum]|uniref:Toxin-antitoxin system YwqK family antitoxin n=1 Tax=Flavobacterium procerum TaxID=1455569 RepID=A0ABV6BQA8_9FLAO
MKNRLILIILSMVFVACTTMNYPNHPKWLCNKKYACLKHPPPDIKENNRALLSITISSGNYVYLDFPNEDSAKNDDTYLLQESFFDGEPRIGKIIDGFKEGKWLSDNVCEKGQIGKEEYFKHGLRDSIFKQFDRNGKIIYETTFKNGTGLWKEFHSNGKLYFEIYSEEGFFTDTLRLYNKEGKIFEKRLYQNDTLVYYIGNSWCLKYRYNPNDTTYLEVDSYQLKELKQGAFRNTFRYMTKEEFKDDYFAEKILKR